MTRNPLTRGWFVGVTSVAVCLSILSVSPPVYAQKRILALGWNVEDNDSRPSFIGRQLEELEGYDVLGLCEVDPANEKIYAAAAAVGEGAKGMEPKFESVLGTTGVRRLMAIYDAVRFERVGEPIELHKLNNDRHRSPLVVQLRLKGTATEFMFMVNHLARFDEELRAKQAAGLREWAAQQKLPVVAVGDYNFDYDIDDGEGNEAMKKMLEGGVFQWVQPADLLKTQASPEYNSVLDFALIAHQPAKWKVSSRIVREGFSFPDDRIRSDHRPVTCSIFVSP